MMKNLGDSQDEIKADGNPMRKLEDALVICKFGWFNLQLMIASFFSVMATTCVTTGTSYILPSAECDLDMTMMQKGLLNAIPFIGQFSATLFTGFITDAFGRKIFLVGGNIGIFVFALFGAASQTYSMLLAAKLLEGVVMSVVFTATATMIPEFTHMNVRDRVLVLNSANMSLSLILSTLTAWPILPRKMRFVIVEGYFVINEWNIYLFLCSLWSLIAAVMYWYLPESPKFLLSHGHEKEALKILKRMYRVNTGKDNSTFPMTSLNVPGGYKSVSEFSFKKKITNALFEAKELFRPPLVYKLILFSVSTFVCLLSYSALRLWFPQLSTMVENYQREHDGRTDRFCVVLNSYMSTKTNYSQLLNVSHVECIPRLSGTETYTNGIILGVVSLVCISLSGYVVNFFGPKPLMFIFLLLCSTCSSALYWTNSSIQIAILISATCGFMQTAFSFQFNIVSRVFPTTVRTLTLSIVIMLGRAGSLLGNILFPVMMEYGCMVPFLTLSAVTLIVAGLVYFMPNPQKENSGTGLISYTSSKLPVRELVKDPCTVACGLFLVTFFWESSRTPWIGGVTGALLSGVSLHFPAGAPDVGEKLFAEGFD